MRRTVQRPPHCCVSCVDGEFVDGEFVDGDFVNGEFVSDGLPHCSTSPAPAVSPVLVVRGW